MSGQNTIDPGCADGAVQRRRALRTAAIAARERLSASAHAQASAALVAHLQDWLAQYRPQPAVIAFCWPWRAEVDLRACLLAWQAAGPDRRLALPVVEAPGQPLCFRHWWAAAPMSVDRHGVPVPAGTAPLWPALVMVPLNAFDARGFRLGYGGGYFDRTLAQGRPRPATVGIGFELGRVDSVWPQPHDVPLDWLATEQGVWPAIRPEGTPDDGPGR